MIFFTGVLFLFLTSIALYIAGVYYTAIPLAPISVFLAAALGALIAFYNYKNINIQKDDHLLLSLFHERAQFNRSHFMKICEQVMTGELKKVYIESMIILYKFFYNNRDWTTVFINLHNSNADQDTRHFEIINKARSDAGLYINALEWILDYLGNEVYLENPFLSEELLESFEMKFRRYKIICSPLKTALENTFSQCANQRNLNS